MNMGYWVGTAVVKTAQGFGYVVTIDEKPVLTLSMPQWTEGKAKRQAAFTLRSYRTAYKDGYENNRLHGTTQDNPYKTGNRLEALLHKAWQDGWTHADKKYGDNS